MEVESYLNNLSTVDSKSYEIVKHIKSKIHAIHPNVKEKIMYGGIVFFIDDEMVSGVFVRKKHISLEFGNGYLMDDPQKYLEGKGKFRRHLKIRNAEDLTSKDISFYINQVI